MWLGKTTVGFQVESWTIKPLQSGESNRGPVSLIGQVESLLLRIIGRISFHIKGEAKYVVFGIKIKLISQFYNCQRSGK